MMSTNDCCERPTPHPRHVHGYQQPRAAGSCLRKTSPSQTQGRSEQHYNMGLKQPCHNLLTDNRMGQSHG
eukprot:765609-Amphidinium_carterae.1